MLIKAGENSQQFTVKDAEQLVQAAQMAPLQNLHSAQKLSESIMRFRIFCVQHFKLALDETQPLPIKDGPADGPDSE